jgi:hypothetical protein
MEILGNKGETSAGRPILTMASELPVFLHVYSNLSHSIPFSGQDMIAFWPSIRMGIDTVKAVGTFTGQLARTMLENTLPPKKQKRSDS